MDLIQLNKLEFVEAYSPTNIRVCILRLGIN